MGRSNEIERAHAKRDKNAPVKIRLDPADEYMHALEDASNFNESMYFNVYDPAEKIGGFLRLGNRANEGYAEMTTCLYLPDGRVGFMYGRPEIANNDAFNAGGMNFEVATPFEALRATYGLDRKFQLCERHSFTPEERGFVQSSYRQCVDHYNQWKTEEGRQWSHWSVRYIDYFGPRGFIPQGSSFI